MRFHITARGKSLALTLVLMMFMLNSVKNIATASPGPTYAVDPSLVETEPGASFTIDIDISGAVGVYGWEFKLKWDRDLLDVTSVTEGAFLKSGGIPTSFAKTELAQANLLAWMTVGCTRLGAVPGADGDGILASITFSVEIVDECSLDLYDSYWMDPSLVKYYDIAEVDGYVDSWALVPPVADFTWSPKPPKPLIVNETVTFNATFDPTFKEGSYDPDGGSITSYIWDFDDGNTTTTTEPLINHTYTVAKGYNVNLTVTDDEGESSWIMTTVGIHIVDIAIVNVEPSARMVLPEATVNIKVSIKNLGTFETFTKDSTGTLNITAYYYNSTHTGIIGEKTFQSVPRHELLNTTISWNTIGVSSGVYTIKANVSDPLYGEKNLTNNEFVDGTVTISQLEILTHEVVVGGFTFIVLTNSSSKVSNFGFSPALKEISFDVTGSEGALGFCNVTIPIVFLGGDFTVLFDGVSIESTLTQNATHSFIYFNYTHTTHKIRISGTTVATPPTADFTVSKKNPYVGETIMFNASASIDPDGFITYYTWNFADSNITAVADPIIYHSYASIGYYRVSLTVTDNHGLNNTKQLTLAERIEVVSIHDVSVLGISVSSSTIAAGETVSINITVKNEGYSSESFNVTVSYNETVITNFAIESLAIGVVNSTIFDWNTTGVPGGTYLLKAEANLTRETPAFLDDNIKEIEILIQEKPIADFSYTPVNPIVGESIMFIASASYDPDGSITDYGWCFGDGNVSTGTIPTVVHAYPFAGTYSVNLTVTDNDGLTTQKIKQVSIGKMISNITLTLSSTTISVDESITINGSITPKRVGATVTISYKTGETWEVLAVVITDENGQYSYDWEYAEAGTYEVKASWEGDANTLPHETDVQTLTVNAPFTNLLLYIIVGVIAAALALGLVYKFILRKPKST